MLVVLRALKLWVPALAESRYQDHNLTFFIYSHKLSHLAHMFKSNPFKPNGISHGYLLDQSISDFKGCWVVFYIFI